jgi:hypothetical protein
LTVLRLSGRLSRRTFLSLLASLEGNLCLEELSLRLESLPQLAGQDHYGRSLAPSKLGVQFQTLRSIILGHLGIHGPRLRSVIVDIRQDIDFCRPSLSFTTQDIASMIKSCPSLEFLGIPIDFYDLLSDQAKYLHYPAKLQALHLRGEYGALSDLVKNTNTLIDLLKAPPSLQTFVGHGKMLKNIQIRSLGNTFSTRVSKSQKLAYCLNL